MIQRIQTIWLLFASACAFASIKLPFYVGTKTGEVISHELTGTENFYIMMLTIAVGALAFFIIFMYKNRKLQVRLSVLGIMLELLLIFLLYIQTRNYPSGTYALSAILHSGVVFFLFLAIRGISKDAKIIRDSNRLR